MKIIDLTGEAAESQARVDADRISVRMEISQLRECAGHPNISKQNFLAQVSGIVLKCVL